MLDATGLPGFDTVMDAVKGEVMSELRIEAWSWEPETNVVERGLPFQLTTAPDWKPVPFTVRVKSPPPGATASGTSGSLTRGTGSWARNGAACQTPTPAKSSKPANSALCFIPLRVGFMLSSPFPEYASTRYTYRPARHERAQRLQPLRCPTFAYRERRKLIRSCWLVADRALKLPTTALASEAGYCGFGQLLVER